MAKSSLMHRGMVTKVNVKKVLSRYFCSPVACSSALENKNVRGHLVELESIT